MQLMNATAKWNSIGSMVETCLCYVHAGCNLPSFWCLPVRLAIVCSTCPELAYDQSGINRHTLTKTQRNVGLLCSTICT